MSGQSTLFAEGTHASPLASPGTDAARKMTVTSGRKCVGSWTNSGPLGSLERMLLGTSAWGSMTCFLTWRHATTPAGRLLFQLAPSTPHIDATESGLLPTPVVMYTRETWDPRRIAEKQAQVKETTNKKGKHHSGNGFGLNLPQALRLLPTPSAREGRDWSRAQILAGLDRGGCVARRICADAIPSSQEIVGLNPCFAEWMMGFPIGWTDLKL